MFLHSYENGNAIAILSAQYLFFNLSLFPYSKITKEKLIAVTFLLFDYFLWAIFEQSPNSLTIFCE
jgi:POT family proton-dependent oligopeptide transporter